MATPITPPVTDTPTARTAEGVGTTATPTARTAVTPATTAVPTARGAITPSTTPVPTARTSLTPATTAIPTARSAVTPSSNPTPTAVGPLSPVAALRTGGDVVNLDFCQQLYNVDFTYSRGSAATYIGRQINAFNQYEYILKTDPLTGASPRIEYDAATGECLGYLAEGASTNLALRSEEFNDAYWTKTNSEIVENQTISPDGTLSGNKFEWSTTGTNSGQLIRNLTTVIGDIYTFSVFAKASEQRFVQIGYASSDVTGQPFVNIDLATGLTSTVPSSVINFSIVDAGNGWFRISITVEVISTSTANFLFIGRSLLDTFSASGSAVDGHGVYIWGAQVEPLPFATSYIRTEGSAVTRAADILNTSGAVPAINQPVSMSVTASVLGVGAASSKTVIRNDGIVNRLIYLSFGGDNSGRAFHSASPRLVIPTVVPMESYKIDYTFSFNTFSLYLDGVFDESNIGDIETGAPTGIINIGHAGSGGAALFGHIKKAVIYNIALTADEVKAL